MCIVFRVKWKLLITKGKKLFALNNMTRDLEKESCALPKIRFIKL